MGVDMHTSSTLGELMLSVAHRVNLVNWSSATAGPQLPDSTNDRALLKRAVNEGYERFVRWNPRWRFLEETVSIALDPTGLSVLNIAADPARYRLPFHVVGMPKGNWRYVEQTAPTLEIISVDHQTIEMYRQRASSSGTCLYATCKPLLETPKPVASAPQWEAIFWPSPSNAYTVTNDFRVVAVPMIDLSQRHIAGREHDRAIVDAAVHEFRCMDGSDSATVDREDKRFEASVTKSKAIDDENRPRVLGTLIDTTRHGEDRTHRSRRGGEAVYFNGQLVP